MPNFNGVWSLTTQLQYRSDWPVFIQNRGLFFGGHTGSAYSNVIDYIDITSTGNAQDFGDLTVARRDAMAVSSGTRAVYATGVGTGNVLDTMDYVTIASTGNATDFGDTTVVAINGSGTGSSTRGLLSLGQTGNGGAYSGIIEYITIANTGNSTDFGDLTVGRAYGSDSAFSSPTRGVFYGGYAHPDPSDAVNTIDYVTIASTGNATDFGDTSVTRYGMGGASSSTRGLGAGGNTSADTIDYITIASTGNAQDFGNLTLSIKYLGGTSNGTRGVFGGGQVSSTYQNTIAYVTIASTGDAADFGDLTVARGRFAATSGSHGGI